MDSPAGIRGERLLGDVFGDGFLDNVLDLLRVFEEGEDALPGLFGVDCELAGA